MDVQVFKQTIEQSCVSLGCCLKHSLSRECFTTNTGGINVFLSVECRKTTQAILFGRNQNEQLNIYSSDHQCGLKLSRPSWASSLHSIFRLMEHGLQMEALLILCCL